MVHVVIESPSLTHPPTMVTFKKTLPYGPGHLDCTMLQSVGEGMRASSGEILRDGYSETLTEQLNPLDSLDEYSPS